MEGDILKGEFLNGSEEVADKWNACNRIASRNVKKKGENKKKGYMREKTARKKPYSTAVFGKNRSASLAFLKRRLHQTYNAKPPEWAKILAFPLFIG